MAVRMAERVRSAYVPVMVGDRLAFRYDPARRIIEWQTRGEKHYFDLAALEERAALSDQQCKAQSGE